MVRPEAEVMMRQHLSSFVGICGATAGAKGGPAGQSVHLPRAKLLVSKFHDHLQNNQREEVPRYWGDLLVVSVGRMESSLFHANVLISEGLRDEL